MPDYENELWEHQKSCIAQANEAVKKGENAVISLPPGAGKSRMMLEVVKEFLSSKNDARILIVANRRVLLDSVWRAEIHKWTPELGSRVATVDGRREPSTRETFWSNAKEYNYAVIATPHIVTKDIAAGSLNVNDFNLIIVDEVHHSIKFTGGAYKRSSNYQFLDAFNQSIIGITIRSNIAIPRKVVATSKLLNAVLITDESARERNLEKQVIHLENSRREAAEEILDKEIGKLLAMFKSKYPGFNGFPFGDLERTKKACNLTGDVELKKLNLLAGQYYKIKTVKRYLDEDNAEYVRQNLLPSTDFGWGMKLTPVLEEWEKIKLKTALDTTKKENGESRPVIIFVRFRATAKQLYTLLKEEGINARLLIGGIYDYPSEKLKEFTRKEIKVLVATEDMCGEGLNLGYFRTIILCGGIQNEFKRLNIEGRIRGGKLIQLLYNNSDEVRGMVTKTNENPQNASIDDSESVNILSALWAFLLTIFNWLRELWNTFVRGTT